MRSRLPYIYSSKELLELRLWKRKVYEKFAIKNRLKRERNAACRQISLVAQAVITTIRQQVKQFPGVDTIHPFDKVRSLVRAAYQTFGNLIVG